MPAILAVLPLLQSAISTIAAFKGDAAAAKTTGYVQDAASVIAAVTPLVQSFANGNEVTPDDVKAALAGKDAALSEFDKLIAQKDG